MAYILPVTTDPSPAPAGKVKIVALVDGLYIVDDQGTQTGPFGPAGAGSGDMLKTTYDVDDDGFVDVAEGLRETSGPTTLTISGVGNGQYLKRVGTEIVGDSPAGTGDMNQTEYDTDDDGTVNSASGLKETSGPTVLTMGDVADGQFLKRFGSTVVGSTPAGSGDMEKSTYDQDDDGVVDDSEKLAGVTPTTPGLNLLSSIDAGAQRTYLGLGDASTKDVGTGTGTVAAGDHEHVASEVGTHEFVLQWVIGNGVDEITTSTPVFPQEIPADANIVGWTLYAPNESGSITLDVWIDDYEHLPLTGVDSICGVTKAILSSAQTAQDLTISTWDPEVFKGYWIQPEIESASTLTLVVISIRLERS